MRKTPSVNEKERKEKGHKPIFTLSGNPGGGGPKTHQEHKDAKKKKDKSLMNEQNWQLAQGDGTDRYVPNQLPFFNTQESESKMEVEGSE